MCLRLNGANLCTTVESSTDVRMGGHSKVMRFVVCRCIDIASDYYMHCLFNMTRIECEVITMTQYKERYYDDDASIKRVIEIWLEKCYRRARELNNPRIFDDFVTHFPPLLLATAEVLHEFETKLCEAYNNAHRIDRMNMTAPPVGHLPTGVKHIAEAIFEVAMRHRA